MKYGIITHYDVHNHGAVLQLNALVKVLQRDFCKKAKALQFEKNYDFLGHNLRAKYEISLKSISIYIKYLWNNGLNKTLYNIKKKKLLDSFKTKEKLIGPYYTECVELDGVIVGSDEVFALHTGLTPVFFGHACPSINVFSYAGSFGPTTLEDVEKLHCGAIVASGLSTMKGVSVRDKNSFVVTKELTGKEPVMVCDPVILYGYNKEISSFEAPKLPRYLLVYSYDQNMNTEEEVNCIKRFAKEQGLKILSPGFYHSWVDYNINVDPVELLRYFRFADFVLTDTFHGSVMSIITGTDMAVRLRGNGNKLRNLLEEYGLLSRIISEQNSLAQIFVNKIDWRKVDEEIAARRSVSLDYLNSMINIEH